MSDNGGEITKAQATLMVGALALKFTARAILGNRFAASLYRSIRGKFSDLQDKLVKLTALASVDSLVQPAAIRNRRDNLIIAATDEIKGAFQDIVKISSDGLDALSPIEVAATRQIIDAELVGIGIDLFTNAPTKASMAALAADNIVGGLSIVDTWDRQEQQLVNIFTREMNLGVRANETINQLVSRITGGGTPEAPHKGIINTAADSAKAITDSSVHGTQNNARVATYEANDSIFDIITHLSVLDNKTSLICLARAGKSWDAQTKAPIGHNFPFAVPPLHPSCRSGLIPNMSIGGPQTHLTATHFIKSLTSNQLDDLLGPGRASLYLSGKINISQLVDQSDRPLTLVELAQL